jgi:hypothetical protein
MSEARGRKRHLILLGMTCILILYGSITTIAQASLVTFRFAGELIDPLPSQLNPPLGPGTPFSGTYSFESTTPDQNPSDPSFGSYVISAYSITLLSRTYAYPIAGDVGTISVGRGNSFYQVTTLPEILSGPEINGLVLGSAEIFGEGLFTSDALPLTPPSLSGFLFPSPRVSMIFYGPMEPTGIGIVGTLSSLTVVPLPGALLLFGSGLLGLTGLGIRRRLRTQRKEQNYRA